MSAVFGIKFVVVSKIEKNARSLIDQVPSRQRKLLFELRMRNVDPFSIDSLSLYLFTLILETVG